MTASDGSDDPEEPADVAHDFAVARGAAEPSSRAGWPVELRGVTETVVATLGPNDRWNLAAWGVHAPETAGDGDGTGTETEAEVEAETEAEDGGPPATAYTFGRTRTWRNVRERGGAVVTFVTDPRDFVDAALSVREASGPVLPSADAWVEVAVDRVGVEQRGDTTVREWSLTPVAGAVRRRRPRAVNRAFGAVVDATVAASRLDVDAYDEATLLDRLRYFADVVDRCGGSAERAAFGRIDDYVGWRGRDGWE
ncbi:MAG: DUF447 domain-containing protein [Halolamina sp.]